MAHLHSWPACLALLAAACTDEQIVFHEPVNPRADANSGFLGYFTASDKQTTCGNSDVARQKGWVQTAHADAYATLVDSAAAQTFYFSCPVVSNKENATAPGTGWEAVQNTAYQDVQHEDRRCPGNQQVPVSDARYANSRAFV